MNLLYSFFEKTYYLDVRTLGIYRIVLACCLLMDYYTRFQFFELFHLNTGLDYITNTQNWHHSTLNLILSTDWFQILLFVLGIICFLFLLVGYKTKRSVFGSYILLCSMSTVSYEINLGADAVFCIILFWSLFLPLGERFSVDAVIANHKNSISSFSNISQYIL